MKTRESIAKAVLQKLYELLFNATTLLHDDSHYNDVVDALEEWVEHDSLSYKEMLTELTNLGVCPRIVSKLLNIEWTLSGKLPTRTEALKAQCHVFALQTREAANDMGIEITTPPISENTEINELTLALRNKLKAK